MSRSRYSFPLLTASLLAFAGMSPSADACTIGGWSSTTGSQGLSTGKPSAEHRRFEGECGLKVSIGSSPRYVEDDSPQSEARYFARFYFFADEMELGGGDWVEIFSAYQGESRPSSILGLRLVQEPDGRALVMRALDGGRMTETEPVPVTGGWTGVELLWQQASGPPNGSAELQVNGRTRARLPGLDNRTSSIDMARLGAVETRGAQGSVDFDAFVSHRTTPVGPLVQGDATADELLDSADLVALVNELNDGALAQGQPDCNGDGSIDERDLECLARRIVAQ